MTNKKWVADARELLIEIERIYEDHYSRSYDQCVHDIFNAMRRIVRRNATFRTVEVVHSSWILNNDGSGTCKNCHRTTKDCWDYDRWMNYCPNCGADMRGKKDA